MCVSNAMKLAT